MLFNDTASSNLLLVLTVLEAGIAQLVQRLAAGWMTESSEFESW
jgi:hypothetical protein